MIFLIRVDNFQYMPFRYFFFKKLLIKEGSEWIAKLSMISCFHFRFRHYRRHLAGKVSFLKHVGISFVANNYGIGHFGLTIIEFPVVGKTAKGDLMTKFFSCNVGYIEIALNLFKKGG